MTNHFILITFMKSHIEVYPEIVELNVKGIFLSLCAELTMNIWGFTKEDIQVYRTFKIYRGIQDVCLDCENILISFSTSDSELFAWNDEDKELEIIYTQSKSNDHVGKVTCTDSNLSRSLFVTGGEDGYAKVWTSNKDLIREICFPEQLNTVCFLNPECDVLVGHGQKVSIILAKDYRLDQREADSDSDEESKEESDSKLRREKVTDRTFEKLKRKEDELEAERTGKSRQKESKKGNRRDIDIDESFSFDNSQDVTKK
jgi:WD40 repeat protein